jgi:hypothetical protein
VCRGESDTLVAVEKGMIVGERFHQRGCFLGDSVVIPDLWAENGGFEEPLISESMSPAVVFD